MYPRINNGLFREMNQFIKSFADSAIHHQMIGVESTGKLPHIISFGSKALHHIHFSIQYFIVKEFFLVAMCKNLH